MYLRQLLLQPICLLIIHTLTVTPSVSAAVCEYSVTDNNNVYNYNLAASSKQFPHGVLSEDGYYKVSSNGTVVWFQVGSTRNVADQSGVAWAAVHLCGYPICTTIGRTSTITTDLIDKNSPYMGLVVKMWHNGVVNCSLSISVVCDSKQVQGPTILQKDGFCDYVTQMRHPSGCAITVSSKSGILGWFGTLLIVILGLFGGYLIAGAAYRYFYLHIRGIDIIPNLEVWASLPRRAQSAFLSLVRRFRRRSYSSYASVDF
ncbi:hypothetical protein M8C21_028138 [Ambrosia artemisiifolia]|uniref:Uncharacterized protein n=1 Tax=Ambrosia artemisiifolia TaxID=4212 RepID=A0AAD5C6R4_AMBAR|nr:hypothetical protein M8C21_028138 [Ambrosia artemisiifolia]